MTNNMAECEGQMVRADCGRPIASVPRITFKGGRVNKHRLVHIVGFKFATVAHK